MAAEEIDLEQVKRALVDAGITGAHRSHSRRNVLYKINLLVSGRSDDTFGLSTITEHDLDEVLSYVARFTGCSPDRQAGEEGNLIEPDLTIAGARAAGQRLASAAREGLSLVAATGHPSGMLESYIKICEAYEGAGGKLLCPGDGRQVGGHEIRYVAGVASLAGGGMLLHTHAAGPMEVMLEGTKPDIVLGDHGFAGAALQQGIPAVAIRDINDPALAVAAAEGRDVVIVPLDDNQVPASYKPFWSLVGAEIAEASIS